MESCLLELSGMLLSAHVLPCMSAPGRVLCPVGCLSWRVAEPRLQEGEASSDQQDPEFINIPAAESNLLAEPGIFRGFFHNITLHSCASVSSRPASDFPCVCSLMPRPSSPGGTRCAFELMVQRCRAAARPHCCQSSRVCEERWVLP